MKLSECQRREADEDDGGTEGKHSQKSVDLKKVIGKLREDGADDGSGKREREKEE